MSTFARRFAGESPQICRVLSGSSKRVDLPLCENPEDPARPADELLALNANFGVGQGEGLEELTTLVYRQLEFF